jgi:hypothetical protein
MYPTWQFRTTWSVFPAFQLDPSALVAGTPPTSAWLLGYSPQNGRRSNDVAVIGKVDWLGKLGGARSLNVAPGFDVIELESSNHAGQVVFPGDSGAPIFQGDTLIGLAAGFVDFRVTRERRRPFAVPLSVPVPSTSEMVPLASLPSSADPYRDEVTLGAVIHAIATPKSPPASAPSLEAKSCMRTFEKIWTTFDHRRELMPSSSGAGPVCDYFYKDLRPAAIEEEVLLRKASEASEATPRGIERPAFISVNDIEELTDQLDAARLQSAPAGEKKSVEVFQKSQRDISPRSKPKKAAPKAPPSIDPADGYRVAAAALRAKQEQILAKSPPDALSTTPP